MRLIYSRHYLSKCNHCGPMVICSTCGNNCCNGGHGTVNGNPCKDCSSAYKAQDILLKYPQYIIFAKQLQ